MEIEVTYEDIRNGKAADCKACPIALAMGRELDNRFVKVFSKSAYVYDNMNDYIHNIGGKKYILPYVAQIFVNMFDRKYDYHPGNYNSYEAYVKDWIPPLDPFSFELLEDENLARRRAQ